MEEVIVIGGGVAGLSAAIYLARADLSPLVFAGSPPGGQLTLTSEVENYPGYESILGAELVEKMRKQAIKFGARIVDENIVKVNFQKKPFELFLAGPVPSFPPVDARLADGSPQDLRVVGSPSSRNTRSIKTKSVIVATGAKALWLGLESEKRLRGKGVSACAICDGFFFRGKTVAVVGGGDTALEEALTLTKFANKVYLIHRRDSFRASKIMQERVKTNPKIEIIFNSKIEEILGEKKVEGVKLKKMVTLSHGYIAKNKKENNVTMKQFNNDILYLDGVFVAIGHKPDTKIFKDQIKLDDKGYIITGVKNTMTSVKGVFAAGDCADDQYWQAAVAAGMGVSAALDVEKYLSEI